jgi:hypothetical protein
MKKCLARPCLNEYLVPAMKLTSLIALILISPIIFSIFFLAIRAFYCYILPRQQETKPTDTMKNKEIIALIEAAKGKFFSLTFEKKDGTTKTVNAKDKYLRLIKGTGSPATDTLKENGYIMNVNRNKESWFSFKPENVKHFKCGAVEKTF